MATKLEGTIHPFEIAALIRGEREIYEGWLKKVQENESILDIAVPLEALSSLMRSGERLSMLLNMQRSYFREPEEISE